jgi:hypothetical protein
MHRNKLFAALTLFFLAVAPALHAAHCTDATGAGKWGFTTTGMLILPTGPVSVVAVGSFIQDTAGNIAGGQTRSLGGLTAHETFKGTVVTNPDCTGTATVEVFDDSGAVVRTSTLEFVLVNNARQVRAIFRSLVLPDGTSIPTVLTTEYDRL